MDRSAKPPSTRALPCYEHVACQLPAIRYRRCALGPAKSWHQSELVDVEDRDRILPDCAIDLSRAIRRWGWMALADHFRCLGWLQPDMLHLGDVRAWPDNCPDSCNSSWLAWRCICMVSGCASSLWSACVIAVAFFVAWTCVQPIPPGIRPVVVAAFVFSFALVPAGRPIEVGYLLQRLPAAWTYVADPDSARLVPGHVAFPRWCRWCGPGSLLHNRATGGKPWQRIWSPYSAPARPTCFGHAKRGLNWQRSHGCSLRHCPE